MKLNTLTISSTWAPFSTCSLAIANASSYLSSLIKRKNFLEPATLHRSPILTKLVYFPILNGSKPDKIEYPSKMLVGGTLGLIFLTASAIALLCDKKF